MAVVSFKPDDELAPVMGMLTDLSGDDVLGDDVLGDEDEAAESYFTPEVDSEIDAIAEEAVMLGYADDPELMGSVLSKLVRKIKKRVKAKLRKKAKRKAAGLPALTMPEKTETGGLPEMLKNPLVLAAIAGGALLLLSRKRKKAAG